MGVSISSYSQPAGKLPPLPGPRVSTPKPKGKTTHKPKGPVTHQSTHANRKKVIAPAHKVIAPAPKVIAPAPKVIAPEPEANAPVHEVIEPEPKPVIAPAHIIIAPEPVELTANEVKKFLKQHDNVLDDFVDEFVMSDRVKTWMKKKDPSAFQETPPPPSPEISVPEPQPKPVTVDQSSQASEPEKIEEPEPKQAPQPQPETEQVPKPELRSVSITRAVLAPREPLVTKILNVNTRFTDADIHPILKNVTNDAMDAAHSCKFICEVSALIAIAVRADKYYMYMASDDGESLTVCCAGAKSLTKAAENIKTGSSVACQAARTREVVIKEELVKRETPVDPASEDAKKVKSTLCLPLIRLDGQFLGCMEYQRFYCSTAFTDDHFQVASAIICYVGSLLGLCHANDAVGSFRQQELNDFLLEVSKVIFDDIISIDNLVSRIMRFAKHLVFAERCSFFLVDETKQELFADLFDEGEVDAEGKPVFVKKDQIRFAINRGIAGYVATSGEVINIPDVYKDERFNRDIDIQTGYQTKCILSMPIIRGGRVIGVVQMINRTSGDHFTETDESSFRSFTVYCALALHYSILYGDLKRNQVSNQVAIEQLSYHIQATEVEMNHLHKQPLPELPKGFVECTFYSIGYDNDMPAFVISMCKDLFDEVPNIQFEMKKLAHFVLTVRKNYRPVVYHNWRHGFTVAHCMYWILKQLPGKFTKLEEQALFIGSLCHDLDHRGFSNAFMQKLDQPLAALYSTSVMEQHHYNMAVTILQQENHDIFSRLNKEEYKHVLEEIRLAIIATDLALYFGNQKKLSGLIESNAYDQENREHRNLLKAILMTGCDLCAVCKPWVTQQETVRYIYAEFYEQGDEEKKRGLTPIPMMDRNNVRNIPNEQVGFLKFVCLPGYKNLADLFPDTNLIDLYNSCSHNCSNWEKIAVESAKSKQVVWNVGLPPKKD